MYFIDNSGDLPLVTVTPSLTGTSADAMVTETAAGSTLAEQQLVVTTGGEQAEEQVITTRADEDDLGGTFVLHFDGRRTGALNYAVDEENMRDALADLDVLGDVLVTREQNDEYGFTWTITFISISADIANLGFDGGLTGTHPEVLVHELVRGTTQLSGTFH